MILSSVDVIELGQQTSRLLINFGDGDIGHLTFPGKHTRSVVGKDGTAITSRDQAGRWGELVLRLLKGSSDDIWMTGILNQYLLTTQGSNPVGFYALSGSITKYLSDGQANVSIVSYALSSGTVSKSPEMVVNVNGDTNQNLAIWTVEGLIDIVQG
jgi:hypothetical protein